MQHARDDDRRREPGGGSLLKGQELATTFSFLRPNDLVWNYVVGNYLKGETPPPFDLLYWNSDGDQPARADVLLVPAQHLSREQPASSRARLTVCGEKIDLGKIDGAELHLRLARGPHRAVAGRLSQHAAPEGQDAFRARRVGPHRRRDQPAGEEQAQPLDGNDAACPRSADDWLAGAEEHPGSWWTDWSELARSRYARQAGRRAEDAGQAASTRPIEPAPGRYVKEKA